MRSHKQILFGIGRLRTVDGDVRLGVGTLGCVGSAWSG